MQTSQAAERALFLGAPAARVRVVGNAKFEQVVPPAKPETEAVVRDALALSDGRPLWVAGSTHPGEEEQVLEAYRAARERVPGLALLLVPRHVERAEEVLQLVLSQGWTAARRSTPPSGSVDVLVLDTMGELASFYGLADGVFVGGSLVPIGGHDILQPLFAGRPTLFGPHMHNQQDLARLAVDAGAALQVASAADLAETLSRLLADGSLRARLSTAGETLLRDNSGAAREYADLLAGLASGRDPREELHLARQASGSV
jgi:3-deoxy-D-manno-octulosonic-acid transferase